MTRHMKRQGRVDPYLPDTPVTSKPTEVRMGKGKGSVDFWACKVKPGRVMFEIDGVNDDIAREALRLAAMKLPSKPALWFAKTGKVSLKEKKSLASARAFFVSAFWSRSVKLSPAVIETDRNAVLFGHIHRDFMAQPAFPEDHITHFGGNIDKGF